MDRHVARLLALALDLEMRNAATRVFKIRHFELAQLFAPQRVVKQRRQDRAVAFGLEGIPCGCCEKLAGLVIADRRRGAFATLRFRPLDALDRIVRNRVPVAEIFEEPKKIASRSS
jgi:hypothetical protein